LAACGDAGIDRAPIAAAKNAEGDSRPRLVAAEAQALVGADASRDARGLALRLRNGAPKLYPAGHVFVAHARPSSAFVLFRPGAEADYLLVDDVTGEETAVPGPPAFSPEGGRALVMVMNHPRLGALVQIWRRAGARFTVEWSSSPLWTGDYLVYALRRWSEENRIELIAERRDPATQKLRLTEFRIERRPRGWQLVIPN
jgi:hypothetical protein